jgi:hypothetical protein
MKKLLIYFIILFAPINIYSQTVTYTIGDTSGATLTLTPCNKNKALSTIDFFIESKSFYYFDIYQLDYDNVIRNVKIIRGTMEDFLKIYNGFSYGVIAFGYIQINCIMYCNSNTRQYSSLQFADFNLGGGVVHQNLRRIFERSITQIDNK